MKKYLTILAYTTIIIIISALVGTALATYTPWWVLIPLTMVTVCGCTYIDYRHFFGDNNTTEGEQQ